MLNNKRYKYNISKVLSIIIVFHIFVFGFFPYVYFDIIFFCLQSLRGIIDLVKSYFFYSPNEYDPSPKIHDSWHTYQHKYIFFLLDIKQKVLFPRRFMLYGSIKYLIKSSCLCKKTFYHTSTALSKWKPWGQEHWKTRSFQQSLKHRRLLCDVKIIFFLFVFNTEESPSCQPPENTISLTSNVHQSLIMQLIFKTAWLHAII